MSRLEAALETLYLAIALLLLLNLAAGLIRVFLGPTSADRMLAAQLVGTHGVAVCILLAHAGAAALRDVALLLAVLAVIAVIAFVHRSEADNTGRTGPRA